MARGHVLDARRAGFYLFPKGWVSEVLICMYYFAWVVGGGQIGAESGRSSRCKQQGGGCVVLCRSVSVQLYGRILLRTTGKGPHIRIDEYEYSRTAVLGIQYYSWLTQLAHAVGSQLAELGS